MYDTTSVPIALDIMVVKGCDNVMTVFGGRKISNTRLDINGERANVYLWFGITSMRTERCVYLRT